ncbi:hypothetical protein [Dictyobacter kobayashii]|uniref:Uncharacterized protein n=1 Tax=Dictyobacter kobayashii TaxID=2014872 RepID=A0A402AJ16_9CHLR|nr:hypothetical protein [Dictyobacter kobayashii]GCE19044.1 hypothetical protein KDK_28440 [Dictyobacter kobayashii]
MQGDSPNNIPTFYLICAMFMQSGVVGLLIAQSFSSELRAIILIVGVFLLGCGIALFAGQAVRTRQTRSRQHKYARQQKPASLEETLDEEGTSSREYLKGSD